MTISRGFSIAAAALLAACNLPPATQAVPGRPSSGSAAAPAAPTALRRSVLGNGKIRHIVIIVQENRSVDDLFNGLPGADTATQGQNSAGERVNLQSVSLRAPYDIDHEHRAFETEYDGGKMDGFNLERSNCRTKCIKRVLRAYGKVPHSEIQPYLDMAEQYVFADRMFQSNSGPSFPAHQYLVSGTATVKDSSPLRASENGETAQQKFTGGCDAPHGSLVMLIDDNGTQSDQIYPCFDRPSLTDLIEAKSLTWRYYQAHGGAGLWNAFDAIRHVHDEAHYSDYVVSPPSTILKDISAHTLADVVWVTPTGRSSDHPGTSDGSGPSWVATVVDAIGQSEYWNSTAIFVTWDDWGGWFDHVKPPQYNAYELGFRVPLIVIAPYAKKGYVSHVQHEFGSILKFTERAFSLGTLGATDQRSDDLSDCFNFNQHPRKFVPIKKHLSESYFLNQPISPADPDEQ